METFKLGPNPQHSQRVTAQSLRLLHDYVLVRPLAAPSKAGSIFIPETAHARERNSRGIVVAVGPGDYNTAGTTVLPMALQAGDLVYFGKYAGTAEEFDGQEFLAMRETECRLSVPAGRFVEVSHEDAKLNHLVEDFCVVCHGDPDVEAKARLEAEREKLVAASSPVRLVDAIGVEDMPFPGERRPCAGGPNACPLMQSRVGNEWVGLTCGHRHPVRPTA